MKTTKTMMALAALCVLASGITGCVSPLATQSGRPEVYVQREPAKVKSALLEVMSAHGFAPISDGENTLGFTKKMDNSGALAAMLVVSALGGRDTAIAGTPDLYVRFTLIPWGTGGTHVYGFAGVGTQNVYGQADNTDTSQGRMGQELQQMLEQLAAAANRKQPK
jgi:hypothetical protein